jgi:cell division septation protein DedD
MGLGGKRGGGGGDRVLEGRHLIGVFLLMVVISGVVFTLGYVLGRSQYDSQVRAAAANKDAARPDAGLAPMKSAGPSAKAQPAGPAIVPAPSDWDFYRSAEPKKPEDHLGKPGKSVGVAHKPPALAQPSPKPATSRANPLLTAPLVPRGAIVLQVAALTREGDALALAGVLQQKKFPAFVLTPGADHYYRVQVGPYANPQSATLARRGLENEGFKTIVKR